MEALPECLGVFGERITLAPDNGEKAKKQLTAIRSCCHSPPSVSLYLPASMMMFMSTFERKFVWSCRAEF